MPVLNICCSSIFTVKVIVQGDTVAAENQCTKNKLIPSVAKAAQTRMSQ